MDADSKPAEQHRRVVIPADASTAPQEQAHDCEMQDADTTSAGMLAHLADTDLLSSSPPVQDHTSLAMQVSSAIQQPSGRQQPHASDMAGIHSQPPASTGISQDEESVSYKPAVIATEEQMLHGEQLAKKVPSHKTALQVYAEGFKSTSALGDKLGAVQKRTSQNGGHSSWKLSSHVQQRRTSEQSCTGAEWAFEHADDTSSTIAV